MAWSIDPTWLDIYETQPEVGYGALMAYLGLQGGSPYERWARQMYDPYRARWNQLVGAEGLTSQSPPSWEDWWRYGGQGNQGTPPSWEDWWRQGHQGTLPTWADYFKQMNLWQYQGQQGYEDVPWQNPKAPTWVEYLQSLSGGAPAREWWGMAPTERGERPGQYIGRTRTVGF